jgi:murein DD-endopeptidase MepM/ murein hydrolase activator NlpD
MIAIRRYVSVCVAVLGLLAGSATTGTAQQPLQRVSGAADWSCETWTAAKRNSGIDSDVMQWLLGYFAAKIENRTMLPTFLGAEESLIAARDFCHANPRGTIEKAALDVFAAALAHVKEREGHDVNSVYWRLRALVDEGELSAGLLQALVSTYSFDGSLTRSAGPGDFITILGGGSCETEPIYVSLTLNNHSVAFYRFTGSNGVAAYYDKDGRSAHTTLLRVPIQTGFGIIVKGFGWHIVPRTGFGLHQAVDWQAPAGIEVIAAADGTVQDAGPKPDFGNVVRIRHDNNYVTVYAHLADIAANIAPGVRIVQQQPVGHTGRQGFASHLHYELRQNDTLIDPLTADLAPVRVLKGTELDDFQRVSACESTNWPSTAAGTRSGEIGCSARQNRASLVVDPEFDRVEGYEYQVVVRTSQARVRS